MNSVIVTGANGMLGKQLCNAFRAQGSKVIELTRDKVDLRNSIDTFNFLSDNKTDLIVHCAALVGGIQANIKGGSPYFLENVLIDNSVLYAARALKFNNLIYIGSSCMYPANKDYPLKENEILSGSLEPTNESFALAKIFGANLVKSIGIEDKLNWRVFIASNLYGPNDHFNSEKSHLLAAIISKVVAAKENSIHSIEMWGDGTPKREFTHIRDFVNWIVYSSNFLEKLPYFLNTGIGVDYLVLDYYKKVLNALNFEAVINPNIKLPNGNSRKLLDSSIAQSFGWEPVIGIDEGIDETVQWYLNNKAVI
jgi:GDP-L-fucose synthase